MSRLGSTVKNIYFGYLASIITLLLGFASRTVFIHALSVTYLGVNGLFTNILGVLSFAELGIGTAMNYSLYKPVAEKDTERVKSLMHFYKTSYRTIALVISLVGLAILPFLNYIVKDPGNIGNISIYYLIFLFNTVIGYFAKYKFSLVNAEQKNYIYSNINTVTTIVTVAAQIVILLVYKNFLVYLLVVAVVSLIQNVFINIYLNKKYPFLLEKNAKLLSKEELAPIRKNVIALIWHKIGEISVYQTDYIVISTFINVATVGVLSNYNLLIAGVSGFINIIFSSAISAFGNLVATEHEAKRYEVFKVYRFIAFWLYGFSAIAFYILLSPFVKLWIGKDMLIPDFVLLLIIVNYYMVGHRGCLNTIKSAAGVFDQDKYIALLQGVVNLIVSVALVKTIGLPGVFIGTIVSGTLATIIKPIITYRILFKKRAIEYFLDGAKYATVVVLAGMLCWVAKAYFLKNITIVSFAAMMFIVIVIPNLVFLLLFKKSPEFIYLKKIAMLKLKRGCNGSGLFGDFGS